MGFWERNFITTTFVQLSVKFQVNEIYGCISEGNLYDGGSKCFLWGKSSWAVLEQSFSKPHGQGDTYLH